MSSEDARSRLVTGATGVDTHGDTLTHTHTHGLAESQDGPQVSVPVTRAASSTRSPAYGAVSTSEETFLRMEDHSVQPRQGFSQRAKLIAAGLAAAVAVGAIAGGVVGSRSRSRDGSDSDDGCGYTDYRLRAYAAPSSYNVLWRPQFVPPFMFDGVTTIDLTITADGQRCVQIHGDGLNVSSIQVIDAALPTPYSATWRYDTTNERIVVSLPGTYNTGSALRVEIVYNAYLDTDMSGLYLSQYRNSSGAIVSMVSTQFEATAARMAFPCFDEPAYKAVFNVTVDGVPPGYTALGNMPMILQAVNPDGTSKVTFDSSPRMSTYLVALVVAPLVKVNGTAGVDNNIEVAVYAVAREDNIYNIGYALEQGIGVLTYYEQLFQIPYPLPKLDMVAIPDFAAGAMENWGLITYRETALLGNTSTASASELQRITVVVAHEIAHQWFGNLVTMGWWSALWLNEAFATRVEYVGTDAVAPDFQISRQFQSSDIIPAMLATCWGHARQLTDTTVDSSAEIEAQFDGVAYSFGGSVLYMLQSYLDRVAPGSYYAGVTQYLNTNKFGNAEPSSLWQSIAAASGISALPVYMQGYTDQVGYPLVTVTWTSSEGAQSGIGSLWVSQSRHFLSAYSRSAAPANEVGNTWWIPLSIVGEHPSANSPVPGAAAAASPGFTTRVWATTIGSDAQPYSVQADGFIKLNVGGKGFYRVNYPVNLWNALALGITSQLAGGNNTSPLTPQDRGQLVDDIFTFAEGGIDAQVSTAVALQFVQSWLPLETSYEAWVPAIRHLLAARSLLVPDSGQPDAACWAALQAYAQSVLTPIVNYVGFSGDQSPLTVLLRSSVLNAASLFNMTGVIQQAKTLWQQGPTAVPANLQSLVFASVVRWDTTGLVYQQVKDMYENAVDAAVKLRYLMALAASQNAAQLQDALAYSLNEQFVRKQDTVSLIAAVASNVYGRQVAWEFVKNNWAVLDARYGSGGFAISNLVGSTSSQLSSQANFNDVLSFYTANPVPGATLDYQQALESIATRSSWRNMDAAPTCAWLQSRA